MLPDGQRRAELLIWSRPARLSSSTSARRNMSQSDERSRPPPVCSVSIDTASPSRIQRGCAWFGAYVLPMMALTNAGRPEMLSVWSVCVNSWVSSSSSQSS